MGGNRVHPAAQFYLLAAFSVFYHIVFFTSFYFAAVAACFVSHLESCFVGEKRDKNIQIKKAVWNRSTV